jgi:hypothetical protein
MAVGEDVHIAKRVAKAMQTLHRGGADAVEIHGAWPDQVLAKSIVSDFVQAFELKVTLSELPDGFTVSLHNPPGRTISVDL